MLCLDANALIDYLEGVDAIGDFIRARSREPMFAPAVALHEVFVGAVHLHGEDGLEEVQDNLDWVEPMPLTAGAAAETARIDAELHEQGEPIGPMDTLIAGIIRDAGGSIVTNDERFARVDGLNLHHYDTDD